MQEDAKYVVYKNGDFYLVEDGITWERENDPNWLTTIPLGCGITKTTHRLMTLREIVLAYPDSFFNERGELIYNKKLNHYIIPTSLHWLGKYKEGFRVELYVKKASKETGYHEKL